MIVRQATKKDLDSITTTEQVCFPPAEAATRASFEKRLGVFPESFLLAEENGKIIGFINGCVTDEQRIRDEMFKDISLHKPDGDYQAIFGLVVLPDYRRRGIAATLMNELIALTRARGKRGLILTCKESLVDYYGTFGYENQGVSGSTHGGAVWYDMILRL